MYGAIEVFAAPPNNNEAEQKEKQPLLNYPKLIGRREVVGDFMALTLPFSFSRLMGTGADFICAAMLAQSGEEYLAASGLITVYRNFVITTSYTSIYASGSIASRKIRKNKNDQIGVILSAGYLCAALICVPAIVLVCVSGPVLKFLGQSAERSDIVQSYFFTYALGIPGVLTSVASEQVGYAIGKQNLVLLANFIRRVVQLILSYGLCFGYLGLPEWRATGLGLANALPSLGLQAFFLWYYLWRKNTSLKEYKLFQSGWSELYKPIMKMFRKSFHIGVQTFNEYLSNLLATVLIGLEGTLQLDAAEIAAQYDAIIRAQIICLAQSCAILVGKKLNTKMDEANHHPESARRVWQASLILSMILPIATLPFYIAIPHVMARPFADKDFDNLPKLLDVATTLLITSGLMQLPNTVRIVSAGALRGYDDYKFATKVNIFTMTFLSLGIGSFLAFVVNLKAEGMYIGFAIGITVAAFMLNKHLFSVSNKNILEQEKLANVIPAKEDSINGSFSNKQKLSDCCWGLLLWKKEENHKGYHQIVKDVKVPEVEFRPEPQ